jgi:hypothetical protein
MSISIYAVATGQDDCPAERTLAKIENIKAIVSPEFYEFVEDLEFDGVSVNVVFKVTDISESQFQRLSNSLKYDEVRKRFPNAVFFIMSHIDNKDNTGILSMKKLKDVDKNNVILWGLSQAYDMVNRNIKYKREAGNDAICLRTGTGGLFCEEMSLQAMDCSEFVSRYLKNVDVYDDIPYLTTETMTTKSLTNEQIKRLTPEQKKAHEQFVSKMESVYPPNQGDIFVWRGPKNGKETGHTGIILEYDESNRIVYVMESIGKEGSAEEKLNREAPISQTRIAQYHVDGRAIISHKNDKNNFRGFYRPKNWIIRK